jgi:hypothetical protein
MNLYTLLGKVQSGKIATKSHTYINCETTIKFIPNTVVLKDVILDALLYREQDETFYISGKTVDGKPEFIRCTCGSILVEINEQ